MKQWLKRVWQAFRHGLPFWKRRRIKGVAVLHYPPGRFYEDAWGNRKSSQEFAQEIAQMIGHGAILLLPNDRDSKGRFVWDFRIEGGDPGQVTVRAEDCDG